MPTEDAEFATESVQEDTPEPGEKTEELSAEEKLEYARQQLEKHERLRRQRIEDAKARIRTRGEWSRARRLGLPYRYTVRAGDTLETIAKTFYAKGERWPEIYEANAAAIPDPEALEAGQELLIP